jgi:hypothetical protein
VKGEREGRETKRKSEEYIGCERKREEEKGWEMGTWKERKYRLKKGLRKREVDIGSEWERESVWEKGRRKRVTERALELWQ